MNPKEEAHFKVLRAVDANPSLNQRKLAKELGISLGKVLYCLQALLEKGSIRAQTCKNSNNKIAYTYLLTPQGIDQKAKLTLRFLERKRREYEELRLEIEALSHDAQLMQNESRGKCR